MPLLSGESPVHTTESLLSEQREARLVSATSRIYGGAGGGYNRKSRREEGRQVRREAVQGGRAAEEARREEIRPVDTRPCVSERTPCTESGRPGVCSVSGV